MLTTRTVVAFDPSKTSTGYAIAQQAADGRGRVAEMGTIKPTEAARKSRWFYPLVDDVISRLVLPFLGRPWFDRRDFTIAVEAVVYGESSSELQFYITQEIMRLAQRLGVNVVTYSNGMVKSWAKQWSERTNWPRFLQKPHMEEIWRSELRPRNPALFPSSILASDDAIDAGWIALLGLYAQAHILPQASDPIQDPPLLWRDGNELRDRFLQTRLNRLANLDNPDLSVVFNNMRSKTNQHLSLSAGSFLPFGILQTLADYTRKQYVTSPEGTINHLLGRLGKSTTRRAIAASLSTGGYNFSLDGTGGLLLVPSTKDHADGVCHQTEGRQKPAHA